MMTQRNNAANVIICLFMLFVCVGVSVITVNVLIAPMAGEYMDCIPSLLIAGIVGVCYWIILMGVTDGELI